MNAPQKQSQTKTMHTPGPWEAERLGGCELPLTIRSKHLGLSVIIAYCERGLYADEEAIANARLIAAAPRLLDSLKKYVKADRYAAENGGGCYVERQWREIELLIAEVTGETSHL